MAIYSFLILPILLLIEFKVKNFGFSMVLMNLYGPGMLVS